MNKIICVAEDGTLYVITEDGKRCGTGVEKALAEINKYFGKSISASN